MGVATIHNILYCQPETLNMKETEKVYLALRSVQGLGVKRMTAAS